MKETEHTIQQEAAVSALSQALVASQIFVDSPRQAIEIISSSLPVVSERPVGTKASSGGSSVEKTTVISSSQSMTTSDPFHASQINGEDDDSNEQDSKTKLRKGKWTVSLEIEG